MREGVGNRLFIPLSKHHQRGFELFKRPENLAGWSETGHQPKLLDAYTGRLSTPIAKDVGEFLLVGELNHYGTVKVAHVLTGQVLAEPASALS
jgi:hypothetical protein